MNWQKMTAQQQEAARDIADRLHELGAASGGSPGVSVSQVARYFDEAMAWDRGQMTIRALCEATGWTYSPVPDAAAGGRSAPQAPAQEYVALAAFTGHGRVIITLWSEVREPVLAEQAAYDAAMAGDGWMHESV